MLALALLWAFISFFLLYDPEAANSHEWYPSECCSGVDCYPLRDDNVKEQSDGYVILNTGEFVPSQQARPSPDEHYYRCSSGGQPGYKTLKGWTEGKICFWAPQPAT